MTGNTVQLVGQFWALVEKMYYQFICKKIPSMIHIARL